MLFRKLLFVLVGIILTVNLLAQETDYISLRSKNKVVIGGQPYYVHIVKKGDSIFGLCKIYNVTEKEIKKENPEVVFGLRIDQSLKIPVVGVQSEQKEQAEETSYIYHTVKQGETLYSLSRHYEIEKADIVALNPGSDIVININQVLKIPVKSRAIVQESPQVEEDRTDFFGDLVQEDEYLWYQVKPKDTYYSLTHKYNITEDELKELNPILLDGLKYGITIRIPKQEEEAEITSLMIIDDTKDEPELEILERSIPHSLDTKTRCNPSFRSRSEPYSVALLLPFFLDKNDEEYYIDSSEYDDNGKKKYERKYYGPHYIYNRSKNYIHFYEGFLIAVEKMKKLGMSVNLHVFDTGYDTAQLFSILDLPEMAEMDMIVGPRFAHHLPFLSDFSMKHEIPLVSPFATDQNILMENPFFIQVYPSDDVQMERYCSLISKHYDDNLVMIHPTDTLRAGYYRNIKNILFSYMESDTMVQDIKFKQISFFNDSVQYIEHGLNDSLQNIAIIPSNKEPYVTDVVTKLNILRGLGYDIKVYGLSRWNRYRNIDPEYYYNLKLSMISPFYVEYTDNKVKDFIIQFRAKYETEPNQYSIHGYDVASYFLKALYSFDDKIVKCLPYHEAEVLQSKYNFVRWNKKSGLENISTSLIEYSEGYSIKRIEKEWQPEEGLFLNYED